ncbi:hypothetical protein [Sphingomonas yantingensis]|uniref:Uncharacterized protein n=1 Tax=Sphingomonas yantingensis TaxID=1241761 RepID=A0A7W9ARV5_9SPHN|nr:hypothetical protein [Sphingomonas yantingensis]MBB5699326.1 hypothetical protein [Sphingomonas yantingensis]
MDGHDDWIDTGFTPAAGVQFQQSSAMLGIWARKADRNAVAPVGTVTGTSVSLNPRGATDANAGRLNGSAVTSGGSVASGYGFTAIDRSGAAVVRQFIGGVQKGENGNAPAAARSTARVGIGRANGVAADGQYCAFVAGGSLSAAQHGVLHDALQGYMDALGVMPLPVAVAKARSAAAWTSLPDGSAPIVAGRGMAVTGLTRDLAGRWYVGNGRTTRHPLLFSRMSPDLAAIEAEFDLTRLGLSVDMAGSCQGMTLDRSDGSLWIVVKLSGASGSDSHLLHFDPATDTMAAPPVLLSAGTNGVAWDPHADCLWMLRDSSELVACDRSGAILSASTPMPANSDQ